MRTLIVITIASLTIYSATTTFAKTPDGVTPANEGACDSVKPWKNLYGLCVAFCEAQDISDVDLNDLESVAKSSPNPGILARYKERQGNGPDMPCINYGQSDGDDEPPPPPSEDDPPPPPGDDEPPPPPDPVGNCLCWSADELAAIDGTLPDSNSDPYIECVSNVDGIENAHQVTEGYENIFFGDQRARLAYAVDSSEYQGCMHVDGNTQLSLDLSLEPGNAATCIQEILSQCELHKNLLR